MTFNTYFLTFYFQTFLSALIGAAAYYRVRERSVLTKLIGILFIISFCCNVLSYLSYTLRLADLVNLPGSIYFFAQVIIAGIIYNHITKSKYKRAFISITVLFFTLALLNLTFLQKDSIASYNQLASSFILILYSVFYFYRLMIELPTMHLQRLPMFWYNSAFLIGSAGAMFLFAFTEYVINVLKDPFINYGTFHNVLFIFQAGIMLVGILYELKSRKEISSPNSLG